MTGTKRAAPDKRVIEIFRLCAELAEETGRPIVPDGHLVGALGEVFADRALGLEPASASTQGFDGTDSEGREVQVKTTTRHRIALRGTEFDPKRLLAAVRLDSETGAASLVYFGPISAAWDIAGDRVKPGQWTISIRQLAAHPANTEPNPFT